jgi:hypothetical protein
MSRTPKAYKNLAQGGGLAEPWVLVVKKRVALEERKNPSTAEQKKAAQYSRMTISCDVAGFLPLLQSGPRLTLNTQGSAEPPPWAKFLYAFGVYSSCEHFEPKRMAIGKEAKGNPFRPLRPSSTHRLGRLQFVRHESLGTTPAISALERYAARPLRMAL